MRSRPLLFLCVFSFSAITLAILAQDRFASVEIRTTKVADQIYMLEGQGGNIGVCTGADGLVMVDSQFEPLAEKIQAALDKLASGKLRFLLNTHHHGDHTGGNSVFG